MGTMSFCRYLNGSFCFAVTTREEISVLGPYLLSVLQRLT